MLSRKFVRRIERTIADDERRVTGARFGEGIVGRNELCVDLVTPTEDQLDERTTRRRIARCRDRSPAKDRRRQFRDEKHRLHSLTRGNAKRLRNTERDWAGGLNGRIGIDRASSQVVTNAHR